MTEPVDVAIERIRLQYADRLWTPGRDDVWILLARLATVEQERDEAWTVVRAWSKEDWESLAQAIGYLIACDSSLTANIKLNRILHSERDAAQAEARALRAALNAIIYASDQCQGHAACGHSMDPWKEARRLTGLDVALGREP